jgi:hypothetical protein
LLRRAKLLLVKRCVRLSVGQRSRVRGAAIGVASAADGIVVVEIVVAVIAAAVIVAVVTRVRVRLLVRVSLVDAIRGWIRCGSGLRRVARGRVRRMMRLSI